MLETAKTCTNKISRHIHVICNIYHNFQKNKEIFPFKKQK